jgi:hypothetical protein
MGYMQNRNLKLFLYFFVRVLFFITEGDNCYDEFMGFLV